MKKSAFKPRQQPLPRGTSTLKRTGLCAQSRKRRREKAAQAKAYAAAEDAEQDWCSCCGKPGPVEHSHLFGQKPYPEHRNNPLNWIISCRACHDLWHDNLPAFAAKFPKVWQRILSQMQQVDMRAYAFFRMRHPY